VMRRVWRFSYQAPSRAGKKTNGLNGKGRGWHNHVGPDRKKKKGGKAKEEIRKHGRVEKESSPHRLEERVTAEKAVARRKKH